MLLCRHATPLDRDSGFPADGIDVNRMTLRHRYCRERLASLAHIGRVIQMRNTGDSEGRNAHRARLTRCVKIATRQIDGLEPTACIANGFDFAMRRWIMIDLRV